MRKIIYAIFGLAMLATTITFPPPVSAATLQADTLIKGTTESTVYYYATDGKRYAFPNQRVYESWFISFSDINVLTDAELAQIPLGGIVWYRPGIMLVKIQTDPKVYAVGHKGVLRWIKTEALARALYGEDWNQLIDDVPVSFFGSYFLGLPVSLISDYSPDDEIASSPSISHDKGLKLGHLKRGSDTDKCRAIPAVPAVKIGRKGPATPAISARDCARDKHDDDEDEDEDEDEDRNDLDIFSVNATTSTSTAAITWFTDEKSTGKVTYNTAHLAGATSTNQTVNNTSLTKFHNFLLEGLTPATTYYYQVESTDEDGNTAKSVEKTFTTKSATTTDTVAPVISNLTATPAIHSAVINWNTNEASNSVVVYADQSLTTATTSQTVTSSAMFSAHSLSLTGLNASTTYYYVAKSADSSGNLATSTEKTFTTLSQSVVDITPPVFSNIQTSTATTTATVTWTTNEPATSYLKYSLDNLDTATTTWVLSASALITSHSLTALGLNASSTYYFMLQSVDGSGNTATSTQQTFVTTP